MPTIEARLQAPEDRAAICGLKAFYAGSYWVPGWWRSGPRRGAEDGWCKGGVGSS